jgi:hypothetical protein
MGMRLMQDTSASYTCGTRPCCEARWTVRSMMETRLMYSGQLSKLYLGDEAVL